MASGVRDPEAQGNASAEAEAPRPRQHFIRSLPDRERVASYGDAPWTAEVLHLAHDGGYVWEQG